MLATIGESFKNKIVAVSGFGNVAWGAITKAPNWEPKWLPSVVPTDMYMIPTAFQEKKLIICSNYGPATRNIVAPMPSNFQAASFSRAKAMGSEVRYCHALGNANELDREDATHLVAINASVLPRSQHAMHPEAIEIFREQNSVRSCKAVNAAEWLHPDSKVAECYEAELGREEVDRRLHELCAISILLRQIRKAGRRVCRLCERSKYRGFLKVAMPCSTRGLCNNSRFSLSQRIIRHSPLAGFLV
jgi:glutamate dehydrogenase (NADP+)